LVLAEFGTPERDPRIVLAVSRTHAARLNGGHAVAGMYVAESHSVVLVSSVVNRILLAHELVHAVTFSRWGAPAAGASWLSEGLASEFGSRCSPLSSRQAARQLLAAEQLPELSVLLSRFRDLDEMEAYPAAGSIVQMLRERGEAEQFAALWRGAPLALDEAEWHAYLEGAPPPSWRPADACGARGA
jgi:hypothetical protein